MKLSDAILLAEVRAAAGSGEARRIRLAAHSSLAEVGAVVGKSESTVSRWERGELVPRGESGLRYARLITSLRSVLAQGQAS